MACCIMVILHAYRICIKTASKHGLNTILLKTLAKVASVMFLYSLTKLFNGCISFYSSSNSALSKNSLVSSESVLTGSMVTQCLIIVYLESLRH